MTVTGIHINKCACIRYELNLKKSFDGLFQAQNMGWSAGSNSNIVGWGGSGGKTGGNSHGWVDENQGSKPPSGGAVGNVASAAVNVAAEAAKAEGKHSIDNM
jgi:hypothetical protein